MQTFSHRSIALPTELLWYYQMIKVGEDNVDEEEEIKEKQNDDDNDG